jgi:hypothetical protein
MSAPERVPISGHLTPAQWRVIELGHEGLSDGEIATALKVAVSTVRHHWREIGHHIPGDWPMRSRAILWYRGAALALLYRRPLLEIHQPKPDLLARLRPAQQGGSLLARLRPQSDGARQAQGG